MSSTGAGYDLSPTMYSPDGRIYQVEYAAKAVENSSTAIGIRCTDGVLLAVEKQLVSRMLVEGTNKRVHIVDPHQGMVVAGLVADGRQLLNRARAEARSFRKNFGEDPSTEMVASRMGQFVHLYTCYGHLRPFGAAMMLAGWDPREKVHQLYMTDPSGMTMRYKACAIGKARQSAKTEVEKLKLMDMTCEEALPVVAKILLSTRDSSKDKPVELEMGWVTEATGWKFQAVPRDAIAHARAAARQKINEEEQESEESSDEEEDDTAM